MIILERGGGGCLCLEKTNSTVAAPYPLSQDCEGSKAMAGSKTANYPLKDISGISAVTKSTYP